MKEKVKWIYRVLTTDSSTNLKRTWINEEIGKGEYSFPTEEAAMVHVKQFLKNFIVKSSISCQIVQQRT